MKEYVSKEATAKSFLYDNQTPIVAGGLAFMLAAALSRKNRIRNAVLAGLAGAGGGYAYDRVVTDYKPLNVADYQRWKMNGQDILQSRKVQRQAKNGIRYDNLFYLPPNIDGTPPGTPHS
jgi:uncharacterized membrane protein YebE (DUF533 family)